MQRLLYSSAVGSRTSVTGSSSSTRGESATRKIVVEQRRRVRVAAIARRRRRAIARRRRDERLRLQHPRLCGPRRRRIDRRGRAQRQHEADEHEELCSLAERCHGAVGQPARATKPHCGAAPPDFGGWATLLSSSSGGVGSQSCARCVQHLGWKCVPETISCYQFIELQSVKPL